MISYNGWKLELTNTNATDKAERKDLNVQDSILLCRKHPRSNFYSKLYRATQEHSADFVGTLILRFWIKEKSYSLVIAVWTDIVHWF
jgi:hypothetical protein